MVGEAFGKERRLVDPQPPHPAALLDGAGSAPTPQGTSDGLRTHTVGGSVIVRILRWFPQAARGLSQVIRSRRLVGMARNCLGTAVMSAVVLACPPDAFSQPSPAVAAAGPQHTSIGPLDPLAQAVVDSLMEPAPEKPDELLESALRAADVEAIGVAALFLRQLADAVTEAGEARGELLADLGERFDDGSLDRMLRLIAEATPSDREVAIALVRAMRSATAARRADPARIAAAIERLDSDDFSIRSDAASTIALAGVDALPLLLSLLDKSSDAGRLARELVGLLGYEGVEVALGILGSPDVDAWPAAITAIGLLEPDAERVTPYLLAPALVSDTPPAAREAAKRLLRELSGAVPPREVAIDRLVELLDRHVSKDGPARSPRFDRDGCQETFEIHPLWDPAARRVVRPAITRRQRALIDARHLARDLTALGRDDQRSVQAVLLAQLEVAATMTGPERPIPSEAAKAALLGPNGIDESLVANVLEAAIDKRLFDSAEAAAGVLGEPKGASRTPGIDRALVMALRCPDFDVRFAAARAMIRRGRLPFDGASFVMETLLTAATSRGIDRAVILQPSLVDGQRVAAEIASLGYRTTTVSTPKKAIVAARESCDTRLVIVAARSGTPSAMETAQLISRIPSDEPIKVVILVDPSDRGAELLAAGLSPDEAPPCVRTLCSCRSEGRCPPGPLWWLHEDLDLDDCGPVTIVDDIEGIFEAGALEGRPFGQALSQLDEERRQAAREARSIRAGRRLARTAEALELLAILGDEGTDVSKAMPTALDAIAEPGLAGPAMRLLARVGRPRAQDELHAITVGDSGNEGLRQAALDAFRESVGRFGTLLDSRTLLADHRRYTLRNSPEDDRWLREVLDTVEQPDGPARE